MESVLGSVLQIRVASSHCLCLEPHFLGWAAHRAECHWRAEFVPDLSHMNNLTGSQEGQSDHGGVEAVVRKHREASFFGLVAVLEAIESRSHLDAAANRRVA